MSRTTRTPSLSPWFAKLFSGKIWTTKGGECLEGVEKVICLEIATSEFETKHAESERKGPDRRSGEKLENRPLRHRDAAAAS